MNYQKTLEGIAKQFVEHPHEFIMEADIQHELARQLRTELKEEGRSEATLATPTLDGETVSYKQRYQNKIEARMAATKSMSRVHTEVRTTQAGNTQYDIVVFKETIQNPVTWVSSGTKRYDESDITAAIEVKFIKNKRFFPTYCDISADKLLDGTDSDVRDELNTSDSKNSPEPDLRGLAKLPDDVKTYEVILSNLNYLFEGDISTDEQKNQKMARVGEVAREWLQNNADGTEILYGHPFGYTWLTK